MRDKVEDVKRAIKRVYEERADVYGRLIDRGNPYYRWSWKMVVDRAIKALRIGLKGDLDNKLLLDAGCGNGRWSQVYAELGLSVVGLDFSQKMLRAAVERAVANGYWSRFMAVRGDLENLSMFPEGHFDAIHCFGVIEHLPNPQGVLREFSRLLKPNGILILDSPIRCGFSHLTLKLSGYHPFYRFFSLSEILDMVRKTNGLKVKKVKPTMHIWTQGMANIFLRTISQKIGIEFLRHLNNVVKSIYPIPCGVLLLIRATR